VSRKKPGGAPKRPQTRGRPSLYTPELAANICGRLAVGETLRSICRDEGMPVHSAVIGWTLNAKLAPGFADQYARARDAGLNVMAEEILAIADDSADDYITRKREDGSDYTVIDHDHINRSRLRVDTRKWYLSKLAPKRYGDRLQVAGDEDNPLVVKTIADVLRERRRKRSPEPAA
jgi:hypothetical protein